MQRYNLEYHLAKSLISIKNRKAKKGPKHKKGKSGELKPLIDVGKLQSIDLKIYCPEKLRSD